MLAGFFPMNGTHDPVEPYYFESDGPKVGFFLS